MNKNYLKTFFSNFNHPIIKMFFLYLPLGVVFLFFIIKPPFTFKGLIGYVVLFSKEDFQFNSVIFFFFPFFLSVFTYMIFVKPIQNKPNDNSQVEKMLDQKHQDEKNRLQFEINQLQNEIKTLKKQLSTQENFSNMFESTNANYSKLQTSIDELKNKFTLAGEKNIKKPLKEKSNVKNEKKKIIDSIQLYASSDKSSSENKIEKVKR